MANTGLTLRLIYNKDLFDKAGIANPPVSLQEMVDDAKKITEAGKSEGVYGFALNFKSPKAAFDRSVREILSLSGYQGLGFDLKTGQFDFAPYSQVIEYFKQMYEDRSILPGAETLDIDPLRPICRRQNRYVPQLLDGAGRIPGPVPDRDQLGRCPGPYAGRAD